MLSGEQPGIRRGSRDESAFYQAETAMLTRENQMLRMRIRELGISTNLFPLLHSQEDEDAIERIADIMLSELTRLSTERQITEINSSPANTPATPSNLVSSPPVEAETVEASTDEGDKP